MNFFKTKKMSYSGLAVLQANFDSNFETLVSDALHNVDRRKSERQPTDGMVLRYSVQKGRRSWLSAMNVDVSREGIRIQTAAELPSGSPVNFEFQSEHNKIIYVSGTVLWSRMMDRYRGLYESGIEIRGTNTETILQAAPGTQVEEKRHSSRIAISLPVKYRIKKGHFWQNCGAVDVSETGIQLELPHLVSPDSQLDIELVLDFQGPIRFKGRVVWVLPSRNPGYFDCGISFINLKTGSHAERMFHFMAERLCHFIGHCEENLVYRPVKDFEELEKAFKLVYREYHKRHYCETDEQRMQYSHHFLLPGARTFVLLQDDEIVGTISLTADSPCGLPMESLFPDEVARCRGPQKRLAEVGLFALDLEKLKHKTFSMTDFNKMARVFRLFKVILDYARYQTDLTDLMICVNPKHKALYEFMLFNVIGPVKFFPNNRHKPALPLRMNLEQFWKLPLDYGKGKFFFSSITPKSTLEQNVVWTPEKLQTYTLDKPAIASKLRPSDVEYIQRCYGAQK